MSDVSMGWRVSGTGYPHQNRNQFMQSSPLPAASGPTVRHGSGRSEASHTPDSKRCNGCPQAQFALDTIEGRQAEAR